MNGSPSATEFLKVASQTAHHFGFSHLNQLKKNPGCKTCEEKVNHKASAADKKLDSLHGMLTSGMCSYFECRMNGIDGPALFYTTENVPRSGETAISLHILNVEKSIAEAILIQTVRSLLSEIGYSNSAVRINSLGDTDSVARYIRELTNFLRKRIDELPASTRELMKEHVFIALMNLIEKNPELAEKSPNPMEYLSDSSRKHFREIVEYLDVSNTPYEIDPKLIGHHQCYSDALFAIDLFDDNNKILEQQPIFVRGGRYNTFVSRMSKTDIPATGAVIVLRNRKAPIHHPRPQRKRIPAVCVVQLGFGPKIRTLLLVDELRKAGIPVRQNICSNSLSTQLRGAESEEIRYAVIIGQKEYIEDCAIFRDLQARSQENIPLSSMVTHLKRVVKST